MKRFAFRGARILAWRQSQADAVAVQLGEARRAAAETAALLARAEENCHEAHAGFRRAIEGTTEITSVERHRNWIARELLEAQECRRSHEARLRVVSQAADALQQARR